MTKKWLIICFTLSFLYVYAQSGKHHYENLFSITPAPAEALTNSPVRKATFLRLNRHVLRQVLDESPARISMTIPLSSDREVVLVLEQVRNLFAQGFSVVTSDGKVYPYQPGLYYRGHIAGESRSLVTLSLFQGEVMGIFSNSEDNFVLGLWNSPANRDSSVYVIYQDRDWTIPRPFQCETLEPPVRPSHLRRGGPLPTPLSSSCIRIYFECDYQMYVDRNNSVSSVANYVTGLFAQVQTLYTNENISLQISQIYVWTSPDPYDAYNTSLDILTEFQNIRTSFVGDLAHLLSTRSINAGGIAYLDVLCYPMYAYAYSNISNTYNTYPTYSWSVNVVAHEIGHNVGSDHTHRCNYWTQIGGMAIDECGTQAGYPEGGSCSSVEGLPSNGGTIMSYCHLISGVGVNFTRGFGQLPGDTMRYYVGLASCLGNCAPSAGCIASTSYGSITAPTDNTEQLIENCTHAGEYNIIYSVVSGQTYRFRSSNTGDYLTLTDASNNILTAGTTPITWTATFSGNVRLHVHTSSSCGTSSICRSTYIQCTSCGTSACVSCPSFDFTLTPTTSWQTHTSSHAANGCKIYKVSVTAGRTYTFKTGCGDGATANYDTYLELLDSFCGYLTDNDDGCSSNLSIITWLATFTGDVYLEVRGYGGAGGNYTLAYRYQTGCVASTSYGSITAPTDNTERLIENCTHAGEYNIIYSVVSGQTYRFRSSNTGDYLTLTDASNNILTAGTTPLIWTATFNGDVRLHVHTSSSCGTSSTCRSTYIQCTSCPAPACVSCPSFDFTLTPTTSWQTHTSSHAANGCKIYKVSVTAGRTYTFKTGCGDGATANYDTYLELLNSSCNLLTSDDDGCSSNLSIITWTATFTGDVYLEVRGYGGAGGNYTLAYRYQTGCVASTSYGSITAPTDNTEQLIDNCTYAGQYNTIYSVVSGQTYRFRSSNTGDYLTLTDASNNILTAGTTPLIWTATFNGDVRLHVHTSSSCGTSSTCRSTYVQCTSCPAPACVSCPSFDFTLTPTTSWQTHISSHPANGCKIYKVSVTAGRTYIFKTGCGDGATANYDTYLEIMNGSCALLESNNDGCENGRSIISWNASYTGDAYVRVQGNAGAGGTYTLAYMVDLTGSIQSSSTPVLVRVYPTLSEGEVKVEVRQALDLPIRITVYDARGREVYRADLPAKPQLDTSLYLREAGMYLVRVSLRDFEHTERVLVVH